MAPRLASSVIVSALVRKAEAEGGFAAVLARGDSDSGSVLLVLTERGDNAVIFERLLRADGSYAWCESSRSGSIDDKEVPQFIGQRRQFDPDLWALELDIPSIERFTAELKAFD